VNFFLQHPTVTFFQIKKKHFLDDVCCFKKQKRARPPSGGRACPTQFWASN